MLKSRKTQHSKRTCKEIHQSIITSDFFLLSPILHIFFNGHVPYYLHPHRHEGIVYISPMNQKETTPSQTWRNCLHSSCESKGNASIYVGCVLPLFLGLQRHFYIPTQKLQDENMWGKFSPVFLSPTYFFPHNSFNFSKPKKIQSSLPAFVPGTFPTSLVQRGDNPQARCPQSQSPGSLLPQVPGPPSTQQRALEAAPLQRCSGPRREWKQLRKLQSLGERGEMSGETNTGPSLWNNLCEKDSDLFPVWQIGGLHFPFWAYIDWTIKWTNEWIRLPVVLQGHSRSETPSDG